MKLLLSILTLALTPVFAFAQGAAPVTRTVDGFLNYLIYIAGRALPLLILAAVVLLLFGIVNTFFFQSDGEKRKEGKSFIIWGIVALFVMVSVWGLVNILRSTFQLDNNNIPSAPTIPVQNAPMAVPTTN
ncbi:MAG: hypothetical protein V4686_00255 [Patescibacteria group bacterium]